MFYDNFPDDCIPTGMNTAKANYMKNTKFL